VCAVGGSNVVSVTFVSFGYDSVIFSAGGNFGLLSVDEADPSHDTGATVSDTVVSVIGQAAMRKDVWQLVCSGGASLDFELSVRSSSRSVETISVNGDDTLASLASALSALGSSHGGATVVSPSGSVDDVCSGNTVYVIFEHAGPDIVLQSSNAADVRIEAVLRALRPVWGSFALSFKGESTDPIPFDASDDELKSAIDSLEVVGEVTVSMDLLGAGMFRIWSVTFDGSSSWPMNVGSLPRVLSNTESLSRPSNPPGLAAPKLDIRVTNHGNVGNPRRDGSDLSSLSIRIVSMENCTFHQCDDPDSEVLRELSTQSGTVSVAYQGPLCGNARRGCYDVSFVPTLKGHYSIEIDFDGSSISTDMSASWAEDGRAHGLMVRSAQVSGPKSVHTAEPLAVQGVEEIFHIQAKDRFSNQLDGSVQELSSGASFFVELRGSANALAGRDDVQGTAHLFADVSEGVANSNGIYSVSYTPRVAGEYTLDVTLRNQGGLVATIFRNVDFTSPITGDTIGNDHCAHVTSDVVDGEDPFHPTGIVTSCTSSRIDSTVSFDWGRGSPIDAYGLVESSGAPYELERFSMRWEGFVRAPASETVRFVVESADHVFLSVGATTLIERNISLISARDVDTILSGEVEMVEGEFYPVVLEYAYNGTSSSAAVRLLWSYGDTEAAIVPASALYHSSHLDGSPMRVTIVPGVISTTSSADGLGTFSAVALHESSYIYVHAQHI